MRYLLHESQVHEMRPRLDYLFDIFHLYFLLGKPEGSYIPLIPVGIKGPDVLFITGHTNFVSSYMEQYQREIPERNVVITSCMGQHFRKYASKHRAIYIPKSKERFCLLHHGAPYGFNFNISDAELDFYNAAGDIWARIEAAYRRL